jgi:hypothetical protein
MELCRSLRWKGWYAVEGFTEATLVEAIVNNEVPYQCLKTCAEWGPDDVPALPEMCGSGRVCFAPSPKLVRANS